MNNISNRRSMSRIMLIVFGLITLLFLSTTIAFGQSSRQQPVDVDIVDAPPVFVDDFNDNIINQNWWDDFELGGPEVNETNQQLEIDVPSTSSGDTFLARYSSNF